MVFVASFALIVFLVKKIDFNKCIDTGDRDD
jgi:hypothetical protein